MAFNTAATRPSLALSDVEIHLRDVVACVVAKRCLRPIRR